MGNGATIVIQMIGEDHELGGRPKRREVTSGRSAGQVPAIISPFQTDRSAMRRDCW
jgi:hypothetical protein